MRFISKPVRQLDYYIKKITYRKAFSWGKRFTCVPVPNWQENCIITELLQTKLIYCKFAHGRPYIHVFYGEWKGFRSCIAPRG